MVTESHPVKCAGCRRTVLVAMSSLHPPCFRDFQQQAECPEIQTRRQASDGMLLLMMCDALKLSLKQKCENAEVEPAVHEGGWGVVCRTADNDRQFFSPNQARRQAELWESCGQSNLADEFRKAADEVERGKFRRERGSGGKLSKSVVVAGLITIAIAIIAGVAWHWLRRESTPSVIATSPSESQPAAAHEALPTSQAAPAPASPQLTTVSSPEMVPLAGGTFAMGSNQDASEMPVHRVTIKPFEISKFPITIGDWNQCVAAKVCEYIPTGDDASPVTNLSWSDTRQFLTWLAQITQKSFRLPSEAEWEFAARGGADTNYWWGDQLQAGMANCQGCGEPYDSLQPVKVGSFKPNPFGLYDMGGNVDQWVEDCWHSSYQGAPVDGSPWIEEGCLSHVIRSGSWKNDPSYVRSASRDRYDTSIRYPTHGFRIARSL